jgi:hypothetical protein
MVEMRGKAGAIDTSQRLSGVGVSESSKALENAAEIARFRETPGEPGSRIAVPWTGLLYPIG